MKLKHAQGRVVDVPEDQVERYTALGWAPAENEPDPEAGEPSKAWKVDALRAYAAEHDIDLGAATKKDEILAVITAAGSAETAPAESEPEMREPQIAEAE